MLSGQTISCYAPTGQLIEVVVEVEGSRHVANELLILNKTKRNDNLL